MESILEGGEGRGPSRRMKELSASEIIGGNKDQTTMDENFD